MMTYDPESGAGIWIPERVVIVTALLVMQVIYGSYSVFLGGVLTTGIKPLFLVFASNLAIFFFLLPFAVAIERRQWPRTLTRNLAIRFVLIAIGGVTAYQTLLMMGMKKTSPTIATAMTNLGPGLTFIIASCLGYIVLVTIVAKFNNKDD